MGSSTAPFRSEYCAPFRTTLASGVAIVLGFLFHQISLFLSTFPSPLMVVLVVVCAPCSRHRPRRARVIASQKQCYRPARAAAMTGAVWQQHTYASCSTPAPIHRRIGCGAPARTSGDRRRWLEVTLEVRRASVSLAILLFGPSLAAPFLPHALGHRRRVVRPSPLYCHPNTSCTPTRALIATGICRGAMVLRRCRSNTKRRFCLCVALHLLGRFALLRRCLHLGSPRPALHLARGTAPSHLRPVAEACTVSLLLHAALCGLALFRRHLFRRGRQQLARMHLVEVCLLERRSVRLGATFSLLVRGISQLLLILLELPLLVLASAFLALEAGSKLAGRACICAERRRMRDELGAQPQPRLQSRARA